jgi:uncharacterized membrane protein
MKALSLSSGWLRGLLLASLCVNVLLAAFIATRWVEARQIIALGPPRLIEIVARRLPGADAEILRRVYRSKDAQFAAGQAEYERALRSAAGLLAAPTPDPAALRAAVMEARDRRVEIGNLAIDTFLEAVPQMSPEGRRALTAGVRGR